MAVETSRGRDRRGPGIGRGIALALAELGFRSGRELPVRSRGRGIGVPRSRDARIAAGDCDAAPTWPTWSRGCRLLEETLERFGRVDLWVNNAGIAPEQRLDLLETTPESWDRVLATNLRGPFFLTQAVARAMIDLSSAGTIAEPQIVFITSISSTFASVTRPEYCVAKAGLSMVAQLFAVRLAGQGIRVYEIRPGLIETDMTRPVHDQYDAKIAAGLTPIRRWGTPDDVGRAVAAIASGAFPYSTGAILDIDGGLNLRVL